MICCFLKTPTMATASSSCIRSDISQPSLRCGNEGYVGLRALSPSCVGVGNPNSEFHARVYRSLQIRTRHPRRTVTMMATGTPIFLSRNNIKGSWEWLDVWNALYRERVVFIGEYIHLFNGNLILQTMLYLETVSESAVLNVFINASGGDVTPTMSLYDTMCSLKCPVATHCVGYAYHMAGFLVAAGDKGQRTAMPQSRILLRSPTGYAGGKADDIRVEADELLRVRDYLFEQLSLQTGQPADKIRKDLSRLKRFSAQEALEYGLIDRITTPRRVKGTRADTPNKELTTDID